MNIHELKVESMVLAGWLAPGEYMSGNDANRSLSEIIAWIFASPDCTPARAALIATMLGRHIDPPTST